MAHTMLTLERSAKTTTVSALRRVQLGESSGVNADGVETAASRIQQLALATRLARLRQFAAVRVECPHTLTTARLVLRPLRFSDRAEFVRVLTESREHLSRFCPLHKVSEGGTKTESDIEVFERQLALSNAADTTGRAWRGTAFTCDGTLVGAFHLNDIMRGLENSAELVFWLARSCTGRGYAGEAIKAVLAHAFDDLPRGLGLNRVCALVAPANIPCAKLISGLGMRLQSHLPRVELMLSGKPEAHDLFVTFPAPETSAPPVVALDWSANGHIREMKTLEKSLASILQTETDLETAHHGGVSALVA